MSVGILEYIYSVYLYFYAYLHFTKQLCILPNLAGPLPYCPLHSLRRCPPYPALIPLFPYFLKGRAGWEWEREEIQTFTLCSPHPQDAPTNVKK